MISADETEKTTAKRPHRVGTSSTRVRLFALGQEQEVSLDNLSLTGARLPIGLSFRPGETLHLSLVHPHLDTSPQLWAQVRWSQPGGVGVQFKNTPAGAKSLIRRCMLAEYGSAVIHEQRILGYVVPVRPRLWSFYDQRMTKRADLEQAQHGLFFKQGAGRERVPTVNEAAARAFGVPNQLVIDPAPEGLVLAPPPPPMAPRVGAPKPAAESLRGSAVYREGHLVGYVALTSPGNWSFFDPSQLNMGFMTRNGDGPLKIVLYGQNEDDSLDLRSATSYPEALAVTFGMDHMPELRSAVIRPVDDDEAA